MDIALLRVRLSSRRVLTSAPLRCLSGSRGVRPRRRRHESCPLSRRGPAQAATPRTGSVCFLKVSTQRLCSRRSRLPVKLQCACDRTAAAFRCISPAVTA